MQSSQQRSPGNFNNPFQGLHNLPPYQMADLNSSDRVAESPELASTNVTNGQAPHENRSEDIAISFQPSFMDSSNPPQNAGESEAVINNTTAVDMPLASPTNSVNNIPEHEILETAIKNMIIDTIKWNVFNMIIFILIIVSIKCHVSYLCVLVFLWLGNTYNIITVSQSTSNANGEKWKNVFKVITNLVSAVFKVFLVIQIETQALMITIPLSPLLVCEMSVPLIKWFFNRKNSLRLVYKIETFVRLLIVLQAVMISLKTDNIIRWEWREIFWVYWVCFAILVGITFAFLLTFMNKCCAYMFAEMELSETRGIFWLFLSVGGITGLSCAFVIEAVDILQYGSNKAGLIGILFAIPAYNLIISIYTGVFFKEIESLFKKLSAADLLAIQEQPIQDGISSLPSMKEPEKIDIPKFLTKFSSTYFRRATPEEIQKMKEKNGKKEQAKNPAKATPEKLNKRRQSSLDYSRMKNSQSHNTTNLNLLTVHETEAEKTKTTIMDNWNNTSRFGLRADKGKDFLSGITDRTGVSGIIPSGIITSKTDRYNNGPDGNENKDYSPLTSNDSYLLPPISKDTDAPLKPQRQKRGDDKPTKSQQVDLSLVQSPDVSPIGPTESMEESTEVREIRHHRRVQSMQDMTPPQIMSLREAIESPKMKGSARIEIPEPMKSPTSDAGGVQCLICFDNPPDAVFMECGHGGICYECSLEIWKSTNECYLCRNKITQVLQVDIKSKLEGNVVKVLSSTQMVLYEEEEMS